MPKVDLTEIDRLIASKKAEEAKLADPTAEIAKLNAQLTGLKHKKAVTAVKGAALEYLAYLQWVAKAERAGFAGIKMATTKKRTEAFMEGVAHNYKGVFNQELGRLDCDFNLVMYTSGEQGNTVKEYRLDFAEQYNPSQILSEGEQNACSLADFLTEVQLDKNNCGVVFDDPVTSLDHERKEQNSQAPSRRSERPPSRCIHARHCVYEFSSSSTLSATQSRWSRIGCVRLMAFRDASRTIRVAPRRSKEMEERFPGSRKEFRGARREGARASARNIIRLPAERV